jgi:hypothetical protein
MLIIPVINDVFLQHADYQYFWIALLRSQRRIPILSLRIRRVKQSSVFVMQA